MSDKIVSFDLNLFIDSHPALFTICILIATSLIVISLIGIYKIINKISKKGGKFGPVSIPADEAKIKTEATKAAEETIVKHDIRFIGLLSNIIQTSINNGFNKSLKRQELFDKQMQYTETVFSGIISSILVQFINDSNNLKYIEVVLSYTFREIIYIPLERIYKADKLSEKSKEDLIEEHRSFIDTIEDRILRKIGEIKYNDQGLNDVNSNLIKNVKNKKEEIKKGIIDCLNKAHEYAESELNQLTKLHQDLNNDIKEHLVSYFGEEFEKLQIPNNWNDDMPPNEIIGDIR